MGFLKILKSMSKHKERPPFEVEEKKISVEFGRHQVRVKTLEKDMYLEKCLHDASTFKNLIISRFYLVSEHPWGLHLAPTLKKALDWFIGSETPRDNYQSISWGKKITYICGFCENKKTEPLYVTKVEKVILSGDIPFNWEIEGWRVSEVETEEMGKGKPGKVSGLKTYPIVNWYLKKNDYLCQRCAERLRAIGQEDKLSDYTVFKNHWYR
jgi:hypothetical protein